MVLDECIRLWVAVAQVVDQKVIVLQFSHRGILEQDTEPRNASSVRECM